MTDLIIETRSKDKIQLKGTNFILRSQSNGSIDISNNNESELFQILMGTAKKQEAGFKFIYDKYNGDLPEIFTGDNYNDLIKQVLHDKKCMLIPQVDLILQGTENNIECFSGELTIDKIGLLCAVARAMGEILTCNEYTNNSLLFEEMELLAPIDFGMNELD